LLRFLSVHSGLLPIIFYLLFFNRNKDGKLWVIFLYSLSSYSVDLLERYLIYATPTKNYLESFFTVIEYGLFSIYFYFHFKSSILKKILIFGSVIFFGIAVYNLAFEGVRGFDTLPSSCESILIICYSIFYFYEELKTPESSFIYSTKTFWIVIAILLYLAATFILFISTAYMSGKEQYTFWSINRVANILKNIFLSIAFALKTQPKNKFIKNIYNI
jgi:hypothetical protein